MISLQQTPWWEPFTGDKMMVLLLVPLLGGAVVYTVIENVLGYPETISYGVMGSILLVLALVVSPELDTAFAAALQRTFGWQIGFQVGRPLTLYYGIWGGLILLGAYGEWSEESGP